MAGIHRFMRWLLNGCTALVLLGLYEFETSDVGITEGRSCPVLDACEIAYSDHEGFSD